MKMDTASVFVKFSFRKMTDRILLKMIPMDVIVDKSIWFPYLIAITSNPAAHIEAISPKLKSGEKKPRVLPFDLAALVCAIFIRMKANAFKNDEAIDNVSARGVFCELFTPSCSISLFPEASCIMY